MKDGDAFLTAFTYMSGRLIKIIINWFSSVFFYLRLHMYAVWDTDPRNGNGTILSAFKTNNQHEDSFYSKKQNR